MFQKQHACRFLTASEEVAFGFSKMPPWNHVEKIAFANFLGTKI
jgi:hypothetical protein